MLDYAAVYLEKRAKPRQWSAVSDKEFAFRQMVKRREQFANAGEKKLFEEVAFVLIMTLKAVGFMRRFRTHTPTSIPSARDCWRRFR